MEWIDKRDEMPPAWKYVWACKAGGNTFDDVHIGFRRPPETIFVAKHGPNLIDSAWTY